MQPAPILKKKQNKMTNKTFIPKTVAIRKWIGTITASGTDQPTVTELYNSLGTTIDWIRFDTGDYRAETATQVLTVDKTIITASCKDKSKTITPIIISTQGIQVLQWTTSTGAAVDGLAPQTTIEITIFDTTTIQ